MMIVKINGMDINKTTSFNVINPFSDIKDFFSPVVDFFSWCANIIKEIHAEGFWHWIGDKLLDLCNLILEGTLYLNDLWFLMPAILFMVLYFLMGKNRTTKFILPLWMGYFVTEILSKIYF